MAIRSAMPLLQSPLERQKGLAFDEKQGKRRKADIRHRTSPPSDPGCAVHPENQRKPSAVPPKSDSKISIPQQSTIPGALKIARWVPRPFRTAGRMRAALTSHRKTASHDLDRCYGGWCYGQKAIHGAYRLDGAVALHGMQTSCEPAACTSGDKRSAADSDCGGEGGVGETYVGAGVGQDCGRGTAGGDALIRGGSGGEAVLPAVQLNERS